MRHWIESGEILTAVVGSHEKVAFHFSGGKDSLACLELLRPHWQKITVMWCNTGAAYPETVEQMQAIRSMVPRFLEVRSDQPAQIAAQGYPVDVVPIRNTTLGKSIHQPNSEVLLQPYLECCSANIWLPLQEAVQHVGATLVIRGQRTDEARRTPIRSGHIENGTTYCFPIESWTEAQVFEYLTAKGVEVPAYYRFTKGSLECWSCTAFLDESLGRLRYTRETRPEMWAEYRERLRLVRDAVRAEIKHADDALALDSKHLDYNQSAAQSRQALTGARADSTDTATVKEQSDHVRTISTSPS